MASRAVEVRVHGRVQGVGFRFSAAHQATSLGLRGWTRNRRDGTVEVWAEGDPRDVQAFLTWLAEGPAYGWVARLDVQELPSAGWPDFRITG